MDTNDVHGGLRQSLKGRTQMAFNLQEHQGNSFSKKGNKAS